MAGHVCGLYYLVPTSWGARIPTRRYLPQVSLNVHSHIIGSTSRTTLSQNYVNPDKDTPIPELRYTFPLYDGVSVVSFVCTINRTRVIKGVVQERAQARKTYQAAVDRGETAGLLEQLPNANDVFTTTIGNVPAGAEIKVDIIYLGELKHDAETDGIRFTLPTSIAPRFGSYPGEIATASATNNSGGISIVVDAEVPLGSQIKNVQSPSHPIAVSIGNTSAGAASGADMSLQKASATLSLGTTELGADFVLHVVATNTSNPVAILETHPTIPNQRALMATLVPKFNLPPSKPEIVFLCDRSGSMEGSNVTHMVAALQVFLKSLPVGVKFNICSFGSRHTLLFDEGSRSYDAATLKEATEHVSRFDANYGGTNIVKPLEDVFKRRYKDMDLEVFLLTDGEIWDQAALFKMMNTYIGESKGAIRVFTLGIGSAVSHSLIEGVARAGNGFAQAVGDNEKMNSKVVRMLKASLTPHVKDYTLEVKYEKPEASMDDDDFEIIEKVMDALDIDVKVPEVEAKADDKKPISLFDTSANPDVEMADASLDTSAEGKYSHVPPVAEPKLLQAPFEIPPLFPFNRTSVYLLMSPGSTQTTPKSVILRGTCPSGPLELEIPVTVLPEKGETIHQLAARKAINELEEGRGWLAHAKEAGQGQLLKDKFEGRFSDMVEREAVRLGVTYQVGGKWCSFVAVEENGEKAEQAKRAKDSEADDKEPEATAQVDLFLASQFDSFSAYRPQRETTVRLSNSLAGPSPGRSGGSMNSMKRFSQRVLARPARSGFAAGAPAPRNEAAYQANQARRKSEASHESTQEELVAPLPDEDSDEGGSGFYLEDSESVPPPKYTESPVHALNTTVQAPHQAAPQTTRAAAPLGGFAKVAARMSQATGGLFSIGGGGGMSHSHSRDRDRTAGTVPFPKTVADDRRSRPAPPPPPPQAQASPFGPSMAAPPSGGSQPVFETLDFYCDMSKRQRSVITPPPPGGSGGFTFGTAAPPAPGVSTSMLDLDRGVSSDEEEEDDDQSNRFLASATNDKSTNSPKRRGSSPAPKTPEAILELIVERQAFDGAWQWDGGALVSLLGLDAAQVAATATAAVGTGVAVGKRLDIAATAAVLAYLEVKLMGKRDEWEMMAEKAGVWLEEAMRAAEGKVTVEGLVGEMRGLVL